jgi:hypothetical protein
MIVAASTVAIVAIAAVVIAALIALIYIVPRGGRRIVRRGSPVRTSALFRSARLAPRGTCATVFSGTWL